MVVKGVYLLVLLGSVLVSSTAPSEAEPVKLGVYQESFCPACRYYMRAQLAPVYRELKDIMDIHLSNHGFAVDYPDGEGYHFECQHGPEECEGDQILGCAQKYITDFDQLIDYEDCFLKQPASPPQPFEDGKKCAEDMGIDWSVIEGCAKSVEGQIIHHEAGLEFYSLVPAPFGTPHTTINGEYSLAAYISLKKVICRTYTGPTPAACSEFMQD